jgi:hypothetical protein
LVAAYAIALHAFLTAFGGLPVGALSDDGIPRSELCTHDLGGGAFFPQAPGAPAGNDVHCNYCISQAHSTALLATFWAMLFLFEPGASEPIWFVLNQDNAGGPLYLHKQPRGPPAAA